MAFCLFWEAVDQRQTTPARLTVAGRTARASKSIWLAGDDDWWFGGDNGDRMDVVAENPAVAAGGTARLQVRMPFRSATALVTVMRDGVLDSYVTTLSGKDPVVSVRMKAGYAPNVYVSVLAVRGRVAGWRLWLADFARRWNLPWLSRDAAAPTALIDLAKPSYRLGIVKLNVGWDAHKLAVSVTPDKRSYPVRSPAMVFHLIEGAASVQVEEQFGVYQFEQVFQMISTVSGELLPSVHPVDAIRRAKGLWPAE